jgi:putative phosphoesterase
MRIGLLSDSHENTGALREALTLFSDLDIRALVHCGDICHLESLYMLNDLKIPVWLVAGNMDWNIIKSLESATHGTNVTFEQNSVELPLGNGKHLAATHGDNSYILDNLVYSKQFAYVCHGHTHSVRDTRSDNTRIICPGAISGPRYPNFATAAILDSAADSVDIYDIATGKAVTL